MVDKVKPLKIESSDTGGTQNDLFPTSLNPQEDHVEAAGIVFDDASNVDETTIISRDGDDMQFKDSNNPTFVTLTDLLAGAGGITIGSHPQLLQLIHFIDEGPAEGFTTGAKKSVVGTVFPTQELWKRSDATKLVEKNIIWTGPNPTTIEWKIYDTDGSTVLATITDTISYSGVFETGRVRAIA